MSWHANSLATAILLLLASGAAFEGHAAQLPSPPNILFIYTDDQSHRSVSCYPQAYPWVKTPSIDRLAREGVRFGPAYIGTWCMPSRASVLTGHHPTGVRSMRREGPYPGSTYDPALCPFWPAVFRRHGYHTAQIGKWHTGTDAGFGRDWDFQIVWNRPALPENSANYYHDQLLSFNGGEPVLVEGYSTDNYTRWAVEYVRGRHRPKDKPWCLWLCYAAPHGPFCPADRHRDAYPHPTVATPADVYPPRPGKPAYMQAVETWVPDPDGRPVMKEAHYQQDSILRRHLERTGEQLPQTLPAWVRRYQQSVCALDEGVGKLVAALNETGQRAKTLVVFTSDQGLALGQHGFLDKHAPYDANIAAPLIFSMPGTLPQGTACDQPVAGVDLVPTFFRFAAIEPPWKMHGRDLSPLLKDPHAPWPHPALLIQSGDRFGDDTLRVAPPKGRPERVPWYLLLRLGRYKYVRTLVAGEIEELYDLGNDPEELVNLALQPQSREQLVRFRQAAVAELRRIEARMVDRLPPIR